MEVGNYIKLTHAESQRLLDSYLDTNGRGKGCGHVRTPLRIQGEQLTTGWLFKRKYVPRKDLQMNLQKLST